MQTNTLTSITLPNSFNGKKAVLWLTESSNSATMTRNSTPVNSGRDKFQLSTEDGMFYRLIYSTKFYDFDFEVYHRVMLQEKLNWSYVV